MLINSSLKFLPMLKRIFGLLLIASLAFVSCTKDSYTLSEEELADSVIDLRTDSMPCFQFVFPISFQLADQSVVEVNSLEEAKTLRDSNNGKLKLVYPVEIIDSNGETVIVSDHDQMHSILADCGIVPDKGKGGPKGHGGKGGHGGPGPKGFGPMFDNKCFQYVYPYSVQLPDSSTVQIDSAGELKEILKSVNGKIELVFPVSVVKSSGETVTVNSYDDLKLILDECRPDTLGNGGHGKHGGPGKDCFQLVFPLTMVYPDGTTATFDDESSMNAAMEKWKKGNKGNKKGKPEFQFPIKVIKSGETEATTVNSKEEFEELRKNC